MNDYIILIGLCRRADLGQEAEANHSRRLWAIHDLLFSLGPAWHGNQSSVLLKSDLNREDIVRRILPLVEHGDLIAVMEIIAKSITTVGWIADEEGLDAISADITKFEVTFE